MNVRIVYLNQHEITNGLLHKQMSHIQAQNSSERFLPLKNPQIDCYELVILRFDGVRDTNALACQTKINEFVVVVVDADQLANAIDVTTHRMCTF